MSWARAISSNVVQGSPYNPCWPSALDRDMCPGPNFLAWQWLMWTNVETFHNFNRSSLIVMRVMTTEQPPAVSVMGATLMETFSTIPCFIWGSEFLDLLGEHRKRITCQVPPCNLSLPCLYIVSDDHTWCSDMYFSRYVQVVLLRLSLQFDFWLRQEIKKSQSLS